MIATYGALDLTAYPYSLLFGTDVGQPENVTEALAFFLQDGEVELSERASNRTLAFNVLVEGADLAECAENEAALIAETEKARNTFAIDPEDGGPVTVYETFRAQVRHARDDDGELSRLRIYTVTVKALPFTRSESKVSVTALPATGSTTTVLDACSATTGWTGTADGVSVSLTAAGGAVQLPTAGLATGATHTLSLQKTFAATTTSTKYLVVDWRVPYGWLKSSLAAVGDGVSLPLLFQGPSPTSGYTRSLFQVAASSLAVTRLDMTGYLNTSISGAVFSLDNVSVSNVNPIFGTARQQARTQNIEGAVRSQVSLAIESSTAALGDALVYTYAADESTTGYSPPLRQFRASGSTVTSDSTLVSGASESLSVGVTFQVPIGLLPRGMYLLMARLASNPGSTQTISWTAASKVAGVGVGSATAGSTSVTLTTTYQAFALARIQLPPVEMDESAASSGSSVQLQVSSSSNATYDEMWLFNTTIGRLIRVDCGTGAGTVGGSARRIFIEPPSSTTPRNTVRIGHSSDRSDSFFPTGLASSGAWQFPEFLPPQTNVFVVTPNATDAAVSLSYYPRWHTNAGS